MRGCGVALSEARAGLQLVTPAIRLPSPYPNGLEDLRTSVLSTYLDLPPWTYSSEERKRTPFFPRGWGAWHIASMKV
ncbi:Splicing Factor 45 [Manis pentadactyla]|nr:Splicing Factor 45 [Manis pentadactyla]